MMESFRNFEYTLF